MSDLRFSASRPHATAGRIADMAIALAIFGAAYAGCFVWLTIRVINRRERWAKWTLLAVVGLPVLYVASFGPACWLADRDLIPTTVAVQAYHPLAFALAHSCSDWIGNAMTDYGRWGSNRQTGVATMILHERVKMLRDYTARKARSKSNLPACQALSF